MEKLYIRVGGCFSVCSSESSRKIDSLDYLQTDIVDQGTHEDNKGRKGED